jgi:hypothetical protein
MDIFRAINKRIVKFDGMAPKRHTTLVLDNWEAGIWEIDIDEVHLQ